MFLPFSSFLQKLLHDLFIILGTRTRVARLDSPRTSQCATVHKSVKKISSLFSPVFLKRLHSHDVNSFAREIFPAVIPSVRQGRRIPHLQPYLTYSRRKSIVPQKLPPYIFLFPFLKTFVRKAMLQGPPHFGPCPIFVFRAIF